MSFKKVLVIDDDKDVLDMLDDFLTSAGYDARAFLHESDAIDSVRSEPYCLAIVDLQLADKDGLDIMDIFHSIDPEMPVIILTGFGSVESAVEAMERGAFNYLTKPFNSQELLFQAKRAIEKQGLSREIKKLKEIMEQRNGADIYDLNKTDKKRVKTLQDALHAFEERYLMHLMHNSMGNIDKSATIAGISRDEFEKLLKKHGISLNSFRDKPGKKD